MEKLTKTKGLFLYSEVFWNEAFWKLTASEIRIYFIFILKCQIVGQKESKQTRVPAGTIKNNGQIAFSYKEAGKVGFCEATFRRALDNLVRLGFIDINRQGGLYQPSLYSISKRYLKYDTDQFEEKERPKKCWRKGNFKKRNVSC